MARDSMGKEGMIPANYVEPVCVLSADLVNKFFLGVILDLRVVLELFPTFIFGGP